MSYIQVHTLFKSNSKLISLQFQVKTQEYVIQIPCFGPNPWIKPRSPALQAYSLPAEPQGKSKNTGEGSLYRLQGIFPIQESNWGLLHCRRILYQLSYQWSPLYFGQQDLILKLHESSCLWDILSKDCIAWWRDSLSEPKTNTGEIQQIIHNFYCWLFPQKSSYWNLTSFCWRNCS